VTAALEEAATTLRETFGGGVGPCGGGGICGHDGRPGGGVGHGGGRAAGRGTRRGRARHARRHGRAREAGTGGTTAAMVVLREEEIERNEPARGARGFINL
jgi:hypothetical protein